VRDPPAGAMVPVEGAPDPAPASRAARSRSWNPPRADRYPAASVTFRTVTSRSRRAKVQAAQNHAGPRLS